MKILENKEKMNKIYTWTKRLLFFIPLIIFLLLLNNYFAPLGKSTLTYIPQKYKEVPFFEIMNGFGPPEKNLEANVYYHRIASPAEFDLNMPRKFKNITLELEYISKSPFIIISALKNDLIHYKSKIINLDLDVEEWKEINDTENDLVLYQKINDRKGPEFENVNEFENSLENLIQEKKSKIAYYDYNISDKIIIPNYKKSDDIFVFDKILRGIHTIETYVENNENLDFTFYLKDSNRSDGPDRINIDIERDNKTFYRDVIADDGDESSSNISSDLIKVPVTLSGLSRGIYDINLDISDDLYIHKIETRQKLFAFKDHLFLENPGKSSSFYTNASGLNFKTVHEQGLQEIKSTIEFPKYKKQAEKSIFIEEKINTYKLDLEGINKIELENNDIIIDYNGLIGFDLENLNSLYNNVYDLTKYFNPNQLDYIISKNFKKPAIKNPYSVSSQTFNIDEIYNEDNNFKFSINTPGIQSDIKLSKVKVISSKDPWDLEFIFNKLKEIF